MTATGAESYTTAYAYDAADRLKTATKTVGAEQSITDYGYDPNGNLVSELISTLKNTDTATAAAFTLDSGADTATIYTYDGFNRQKTAYARGMVLSYTYRPDGLRHSKTIDGATVTTHIWDGQNMAAELSGTNVKANYLCGANLLASEDGAGTRSYYLYNAHGDVVQLANAAGAVAKSYDYDAFGNEKGTPDATDSNPFRYCGEYHDAETGTIYLRARYYDPTVGRFTQVDPARDGMNWYTYCGNNPIMFADPLGLDALLINKQISTRVLENTNFEISVGDITGIEHMSGFFQNENSDWYYFFWGDIIEYKLVDDDSIFDNLDSINNWLVNNTRLDTRDLYRDSVYVKGDFTASQAQAAKLYAEYSDSLLTWNGKGMPNQKYNGIINNCGQVTLNLFSMGTLPNGTNVGDYIFANGYGNTLLPNWNMINMQNIFYNGATNIDKFNMAMQEQKGKYEGKNILTQLWYSNLISNISSIS